MCLKSPTGVYRYKYSMRNFTGLEWALLCICTVQLFAGITLLVVNSILVAVEDVFSWGYRYHESEAIFGHWIEYNYTLFTCSLYVLGLALFCCGVFGLCGVLLWRHRSVFVMLHLFSSLVSFACLGVVLYVFYIVVGHQQYRLERYEEDYRQIIFQDGASHPQYLSDPVKRDHYDKVQKDSRCCGYLSGPEDWLSSSSVGFIPISCCRFGQAERCTLLGRRLENATLTEFSFAEAYEVGCFRKQRDYETNANRIAWIFHGCIASAGIILQLLGFITAIAYKLTNFSVIMRPTYSTHL